MRVVRKYEIATTDENMLALPRGAKVLSFGLDTDNKDGVAIWCLVDADEMIIDRRHFFVAGTGRLIQSSVAPFNIYTEDSLQFIGTFVNDDLLVFHLFEIINRNNSEG